VSDTPQEIRLSDYQAPGYTTDAVALVFDIRDGETMVTSTLRVRRCDPQASEIALDGQDLELNDVKLDGRVLSGNEYTVDEDRLHIANLDDHHEIEITTKICPEKNTALEGLYRSSQMYCTQCEAEGFRKITYYQDRPDVLAEYTTTIIADSERYPTLLSNGNQIASSLIEGGRKRVVWHDPFPKPSYLFALVAGNLDKIEDIFITASKRAITLQIYSEPHNIAHCHYAMDVLKRAMRWDEERFGREYDLDIFMIVAVEDFNMGAMENKGLNVFNTSCVLASPDTATDAAYQRVEAVVAHEYFHNWSGNRVTCRDWFQLSLKEGFTVYRDAEFSADMNSAAVKRIEDVGFLRTIQFAEDGGPLAHAVRPQSYLEISNFYTTTIYEKGAEVVRMYDTLLGRQKFRAATDLYFDRFDGRAVTTDDFAAVMAEVGQCDLAQFKLWYDQAGTPEVAVSEVFSDGVLQLDFEQNCMPTPGQGEKSPFHIPIEFGLIDAMGDPVSVFDLVVDCGDPIRPVAHGDSLLLELKSKQTQITLSDFEQKPVVSFLRDFTAPVRVSYPRPEAELAMLVKHDHNGFVRWDALQSIWVNYFSKRCDLDVSELIGDLGEQTLGLTDDEARLLAAQMLAVPQAGYLFEALETFEVDSLLGQRDMLIDKISSNNKDLWEELYNQCSTDQAYTPDRAGLARRALRNTAFAYFAHSLSGDVLLETVRTHYEQADNLTDRRAALHVALTEESVAEELREMLLKDFFDRWQHEALVVDLWFNLQAQSSVLTLEQIRALEEHPAFEIKNPNRARALFSVFGAYNHRRFHALDASGYRFVAEAVARMDLFNPSLAARVCTPLTQWRRFDTLRQDEMRDALRTLAASEQMSKDLYEVVTKALADD